MRVEHYTWEDLFKPCPQDVKRLLTSAVSGNISISLHPQGGALGKLQLWILCLSGLLNSFYVEFTYLIYSLSQWGWEEGWNVVQEVCFGFNQGTGTMHKKLMVQVRH